MKKFLLGMAILCFPLLCTANNSLEFELIRTMETPGFFAVTLFPESTTKPIPKDIVFLKNFPSQEADRYEPVLSFLKEVGAQIIDHPEEKISDTTLISLGDPLQKEQNFHLTDQNDPLDAFEQFSLQKLQPVFLQDIQADFGGNINAVEQFQTNLIGDAGVTFIGKFEKDMKTRMHIVAQQGENTLEFETPLDLPNKQLSLSPFAEQLPQLWEQLQQPQKDAPSSPNLILSLFPWILGGIGILILVFFFIRRAMKNYNSFLGEQESLQDELPWQQIRKNEESPSNPFEIESQR